MPPKLTLRLILLMLSLTATLSAIYWLKSDHMEAFWTSLGIPTGQRLNWCEERVAQLYHFESGDKLLEEKSQWLWVDQNKKRQVLNYLEVEKWFARYCQVDYQSIEDAPGPFRPVFEAEFIDGGRLTLYQSEEGLYRIREQIFASETLRQALKELLAFANKMK